MDEADIKRLFENDRFAAHVGIELLAASPGYARARLAIDERHLNAVGVAHGAAIFSLADLVFAVASNARDQIALGIEVSISFLKGAGRGTLVAEAEELSLNPRLATYLIRVTDESDALIALFKGTVYRKRETLDSLPADPAG